MSQLQLLLFGPPHLEINRCPIELGRRKALALLAYLAVEAQPQSKRQEKARAPQHELNASVKP